MLYPQENEKRAIQSLDGMWAFQIDTGNAEKEKWHKEFPKEHENLYVPASYNDQKEDEIYRTHRGKVYYQRSFTVPEFYKGQRIVLRFDAVTHNAVVWLDGEEICRHRGGFLPFEVDITDKVIYGREMKLTVSADNSIGHDTLPVGNEDTAFFGSDNAQVPAVQEAKKHRKPQNLPNFDFFNYAGIQRHVRLYTTPMTYISDITIVPGIEGSDGTADITVRINSRVRDNDCALIKGKGCNSISTSACDENTDSIKEPNSVKNTDCIENHTLEENTDYNNIRAEKWNTNCKKRVCISILDESEAVVASGYCLKDEIQSSVTAKNQESQIGSQKEYGRNESLNADISESYHIRMTIPHAHLWEPYPDKPYLYTAKVELVDDDLDSPNENDFVIDSYTEEFGIRTVEVRGTKLLINGKPFYFKGFGKHEDFFIHGRGTDQVLNVKDVSLLHWIGANSFRTSHYPYAEEMYRLCDHEGIVIIDETPAVGIGLGGADPYEVLPIRDYHKEILTDLVDRDKNHPSVVMWSMGNEPDTESHPESALNYWTDLYKHTHAADPQDRPVTFVCCQNDYTRDLVTRTMDVVCINRYYGWYNLSGDMDSACYAWDLELDFWEDQHKPVMVTEYGCDTIEGLHGTSGEMWTEEFQKNYYQRIDELFDKRQFFIGEQCWAFADFGTIQGVMRADGNRKGLFTKTRRPKLAAHFLRERWNSIPNFGYKS